MDEIRNDCRCFGLKVCGIKLSAKAVLENVELRLRDINIFGLYFLKINI